MNVTPSVVSRSSARNSEDNAAASLTSLADGVMRALRIIMDFQIVNVSSMYGSLQAQSVLARL